MAQWADASSADAIDAEDMIRFDNGGCAPRPQAAEATLKTFRTTFTV